MASPRLLSPKKKYLLGFQLQCQIQSSGGPSKVTTLSLGSSLGGSAQRNHLRGFQLQCQIQSSGGFIKVTKLSLGLSSVCQRKKKSIFLASSCSAKSNSAMALARSPHAVSWQQPRHLSTVAVPSSTQRRPQQGHQALSWQRLGCSAQKKVSSWLPVAVPNPKQRRLHQGHQALSWPHLGCSAQKKISSCPPSCSAKSNSAMALARSPHAVFWPRSSAPQHKKYLLGLQLQRQVQLSGGFIKVTKLSLGLTSAAQRKETIFVASSCSAKSKAAAASSRSPSSLLASPQLVSAKKKASSWLPVAVPSPTQRWL